ncbi:cytochrome-c peroxidase [Lignipirellula cremea]|uniref:Methylamine utilization protein MauG n=1 Tax=Lignipirellula cremea TaxID=2528010 RepID=A0A518DYW3_9BACT|nr:cytochrome c peroxidase [Lignipirellula cremea]QDU97037.1 Cytochrome c551 peroxidase precursor [Lignipirellula cremea]
MRALLIFAALAGFTFTGFVFADEPFDLKIPAGLRPLRIPADNPLTVGKVELGKQLYFDPRLSSDNTVSCASCHDPAKGWSNGDRFATGVDAQQGGRSAPTIVNSAYSYFQFWDGRARQLEGQALGPIENPIEMAMPLDKLIPKLNGIPGYKKQFQAVFGTDATPEAIAQAIASFERTVLSGDAPYDRFKAGDKTALSEAAQRGMNVFFNKGNCSACHSGHNFSDHAFHNIGVGIKNESPDWGRFAQTELNGDRGSFKTPTLREIARTAPYMHDGSLATLEEVIDYYDQGGEANDQLDEEIFKLKLTPEEKSDLITFLKEGLSSESYPDIKAPKLPE